MNENHPAFFVPVYIGTVRRSLPTVKAGVDRILASFERNNYNEHKLRGGLNREGENK